MALLDDDFAAELPQCLGRRVEALASVVRSRGTAESAPETVALIEVTFRYLGSLWVAEYVHAGAFEPRVNRYLFDSLARPILTGHWVMLGAWLRALFLERRLEPVVEGLAAIEFGEPADEAHPVSRLLTFRNHFAHGSFVASPEETARNHARLAQLLSAVPGLVRQAPRVRLEGAVLVATRGFALAPNGIGGEEPPFEPFVVGTDGKTVLRLHPLLFLDVAPEDGSLELSFGGAEAHRPHAAVRLLDRAVLHVYLERYERERQGHVDFSEALAVRCRSEAAPEGLARLRELLAHDGWELLVVEAAPGCGAAHAIRELPALVPAGRFARVVPFVVERDDLGQSGVVLAQLLLRQVERALGLPEGTYRDDADQVLELLGQAKADLAAAGRRLLVGIHGLHNGLAPYRGETLRVMDVYRSLEGGPICAVATIFPGHPALLGHPLAWDQRLALPVLEPERLDRAELREALDELASPPPRLHRPVLDLLAHQDGPRELFEVCDLLEEGGARVLTPEVERTLAELGPFLRVEEAEGEERYSIFSAVLREPALLEEGAGP